MTIVTETDIFQAHRGRLFGLAYRMLGSSADAEDILQEAYVRWHEADHAAVQNPEAWLVTTTTRLAIDRLRRLKTERDAYVGPWLPEPLLGTLPPPHPQGLRLDAQDLGDRDAELVGLDNGADERVQIVDAAAIGHLA